MTEASTPRICLVQKTYIGGDFGKRNMPLPLGWLQGSEYRYEPRLQGGFDLYVCRYKTDLADKLREIAVYYLAPVEQQLPVAPVTVRQTFTVSDGTEKESEQIEAALKAINGNDSALTRYVKVNKVSNKITGQIFPPWTTAADMRAFYFWDLRWKEHGQKP